MKKLLLIVPALALLSSGCAILPGQSSTAAQTEKAEATTYKVTVHPDGTKDVAVNFTKELGAETFKADVDPATGKLTIDAKGLHTSGSQIIADAGTAQANALAIAAQANTQTMQQFFALIGPAFQQFLQTATAGAAAAKVLAPLAVAPPPAADLAKTVPPLITLPAGAGH